MSISPRQIRAARALLDWSQDDLSEKCGISSQSIRSIEKEHTQPKQATLDLIAQLLEKEGLQLLPNEGVSIKTTKTFTLRGATGFEEFMRNVLKVAESGDTDICVSNVNEENWEENLSKEFAEEYRKRMSNIPNVKSRVLVKKGDSYLTASSFTEYRCIDEEDFIEDTSYYAYGNKLAILKFSGPEIEILVIEDMSVANLQKQNFNFIWKRAEKINAD